MNLVNDIKKNNKPRLIDMFLCSYLISQRISPYLSSVYIKKNITPNKITIHMILSGIIGAIFFSIPNTFAKTIGVIFIQLWFILDCSDGEVARYTKTFSKFGQELDYMAHLINHPLFGFSIFVSLYQLNKYDVSILMLLVLLSNLIDYGIRNITTLNTMDKFKIENNNNYKYGKPTWNIKMILLFITNIFTLYPNFTLFGVLLYFIDLYIGSDILYFYLIMNVILSGILLIKFYIQKTKYYYLS